jgi:molecular chaperone GrpE
MYLLKNEQREQIQQELNKLLKENVTLKQAVREEKEGAQASKEQLLLELLELFDSVEYFINYMAENPELPPQFIKRLPKYFGTIQKKLLDILEKREVNLIQFEDSLPDFSLCQVVDREIRDDVEDKTITKIIRQGFQVGENVLRPVEVITAKKPD